MITTLHTMDQITDILQGKEEIDNEVMILVEQRDRARKEKRFNDADKIRDDINKKGYGIRDTLKGEEVFRL